MEGSECFRIVVAVIQWKLPTSKQLTAISPFNIFICSCCNPDSWVFKTVVFLVQKTHQCRALRLSLSLFWGRKFLKPEVRSRPFPGIIFDFFYLRDLGIGGWGILGTGDSIGDGWRRNIVLIEDFSWKERVHEKVFRSLSIHFILRILTTLVNSVSWWLVCMLWECDIKEWCT